MEQLIQNTFITFPCNNKVPAVKKWNELNQSVKHTNNYGILTGKINDILVIDCDLLKNDDPQKYMCGVEAWNMISEENTFLKHLETPIVQTQSGGLHIYFRYSENIKSKIQGIFSDWIFEGPRKIIKIDILSDNKFVIGPSSKGYKFINNSENYIPIKIPTLIEDIFYNEDEFVNTEKTPQTISTNNKNITKEQLKHIVQGIPQECCDNYQEWIKIIWAIAQTSKENNFNALDIADEFSQKSEKYSGINHVEKIYNQNKGNISVGTLIFFSKNKINSTDTSDNENRYSTQLQNTEEIIKDLKRFQEFKDINEIISIKTNGITSLIIINNNISFKIFNHDLSIFLNDQFIGNLKTNLKFEDDITPIHKFFPENGGDIYHMNQHRTDFVSKTQYGENRIKFLKGKQKSITTLTNGKQLSVKRGKKDIDLIEEIIKNSSLEALKKYNIVNFNGNVFNVTINEAEEDNVRSDDRFIQDLINSHPSIVDQFKFCSNDYGNFNGIYLYGPKTGIWRKEHNATVNKMLTSRIIKYVPMLNDKEIKYIETQKNKSSIRMSFVEEIIDNDFENKIDECLNIFALGNCVYDLNTKEIRKATPYDFVYTNTGWNYNEDLANKHSNDVELFFKRLFPIKEERHIILTFLSSLMHGYRLDKKFLALTDKRNGNNGKSTLISFLKRFFGNYTKTSSKFLLKGSFDKDKDSHDGGLEPLKGKRILVCDELKKNMRLDEGLIKNLAGGDYQVEGRRLGKSDQFKFTWQAGIIMIFNEGDCPKFDCTDSAFMERMVIVPMRSKFIVGEEDPDTFTFEKDDDIVSKFDLWRSSLLKYFLTFIRKNGLSKINIPKSMSEWKQEILNDNNELKDWLFSIIEKGEDKKDFVSLNDLIEKYRQAFPHDRTLKKKDLERMISSLFNNMGVYIKEQHNVRINNVQKLYRNVFIGFKILV